MGTEDVDRGAFWSAGNGQIGKGKGRFRGDGFGAVRPGRDGTPDGVRVGIDALIIFYFEGNRQGGAGTGVYFNNYFRFNW